MGIEQDIKQSSFASEKAKATINIIYTGNWILQQQNELLKPYDITVQQYNVLRILRGQKGIPITVLGITERMLDRMSNASRLVDKLLEKGFVQRRECPNDRRAVDIIILTKGLELLQEIEIFQENWAKKMIHLEDDKLKQLNELLDQFREQSIEK
jgi:DNA-binding MarR family transcriptional regulator